MVLNIAAHACDRDYTVIYECRLPSQVHLKDQLIADVIAEMEKAQWVHEDDRHWLLLSLDEAIVNAMIHGNEGDPSLYIDLELGSYNSDGKDGRQNGRQRSWVVVVKDQGEGFVPSDVPDSDNPDSLLLEHGRGILLMGEWLDELFYFDGGSTIFMSKACVAHDDLSNNNNNSNDKDKGEMDG